MTVAVVVHLRNVTGTWGLQGWVEEVATGTRTPVNGDDDLLARLRELAGRAVGQVAPDD